MISRKRNNPISAEKNLIESTITDMVKTVIPVIIESYDPITQKASVRPQQKKQYRYIDFDTQEIYNVTPDIIKNVPVQWFRAGSFIIAGQLNKGDQALGIIMQRDISSQKTTNNIDVPKTRRKFNLADMVIFPTKINDTADAITAGLTIKNVDTGLSIEFDGATINIAGNTKSFMTFEDFEIVWNLFTTEYNAHLHTSVSGGGPTSAPTPGLTPGASDMSGAINTQVKTDG